MENISLIIFTLCIQLAVGIALAAGISGVANKDSNYKIALIVAAALAIVGMIASLFHLGKPLSFINALSQFSDSWLTKEVWLVGVFAGVSVVAAIFGVRKKQSIAAICAIVAAIIGFIAIFATASSYSFANVPAWQSEAIFVDFFAVALTAGIAFFLILGGQSALKLQKWFGVIVIVALAFQAAFTVYYLTTLGASASAAAMASMAQLAALWPASLAKWLFLIIGAFLVVHPAKVDSKITSNIPLICGVALLVVGQVISRGLFYAMMVVTTVGLP